MTRTLFLLFILFSASSVWSEIPNNETKAEYSYADLYNHDDPYKYLKNLSSKIKKANELIICRPDYSELFLSYAKTNAALGGCFAFLKIFDDNDDNFYRAVIGGLKYSMFYFISTEKYMQFAETYCKRDILGDLDQEEIDDDTSGAIKTFDIFQVLYHAFNR